jgi:hypothetical protein
MPNSLYLIANTGKKNYRYVVLSLYKKRHGSNLELTASYEFKSLVTARIFVEKAGRSSNPNVFLSKIHTAQKIIDRYIK